MLCIFLTELSYLAQAQGQLSPAERRDAFPSLLKVDVDLILLNATVRGRHHRVITSLEPERFRIYEDEVEQKLAYFGHGEVPASIGIVLDVSGSMTGNIAFAKKAVTTFLTTSNRQDEYFLITFSESPRLEKDFTSNSGAVATELSLKVAGGRTSLYDATYLALTKMADGRRQRKALIVVTDGSDNSSQYTFDELREAIKESDVEIFTIGIPEFFSLDDDAMLVLREMAQLSGGTAYFPRIADQLEDVTAKIAEEIKSQYLLGYYPSNRNSKKSWRKIKLKLTPPPGSPRLSVSTKPGYYARVGP